jgi:hypothetical protein
MGRSVRLIAATLAMALPCSGCTTDDVVGERVSLGGLLDVADSAALDAGNIDPSCAGSLFCSSFDQGLASFDVVESGGTLSIALTGFDDQSALHPAIDQGGGSANIRVNLATSSISDIYLRAYIWVGSSEQLDDISLFFLGPNAAGAGVAVGLRSSDRIELFWAAQPLSLASDPGAFVRETWQCLQLHLRIDAMNGEAALQVAGESVLSQSGIDTNLGGDLAYFNFGIEWSTDDQPPVEVLLDDVVLSQSPVECL